MRRILIQHMVHRMRMPDVRVDHHVASRLLQDKHFWRIVHMLAFLAVMLLFAFWSAVNAY